jgi:hypothetical protein
MKWREITSAPVLMEPVNGREPTGGAAAGEIAEESTNPLARDGTRAKAL